jgi:hypothetical protein
MRLSAPFNIPALFHIIHDIRYRETFGGLFRANVFRKLKMFHTNIEAWVQLAHRLIDFLYKELPGLLQEPVEYNGFHLLLESESQECTHLEL